MAFLKYANSAVVRPSISFTGWDNVRHKSAPTEFNTRNASKVVVDQYDPKQYLLTHCTIVASVDTENGPGKLGSQMVDNFQINRKYQDYYITPDTSKYVNHNNDSWERKLLLSAYRTFIGAENYCFVSGTKITMSDGTHKAIDQVRVGDEVLTHMGNIRKVTHTFARAVSEEVSDVYIDRFKEPVRCTSNHPFRKLSVSIPEVRRNQNGTEASNIRYQRDALLSFLRDGKGAFVDRGVNPTKVWEKAGNLSKHDLLLGAEASLQFGGSVEEGLLLGYYVEEGCLYKKPNGVLHGVILTFGHHESTLAEHSKQLAEKLFPGCRVGVYPRGSIIRVEIIGEGIGDWFLKNGGEYSESKRLSSTVMRWSKEALIAIFAAWCTGDAQRHKKTRRVVGSTVSPYLAAQMFRIADIVGIKSSMWEETEAGFKKRQKTVGKVQLIIGGEPKLFEVHAKHKVFNIIVSQGSVGLFSELTPRWAGNPNKKAKKRDDFTWYAGCRTHYVRKVTTQQYTGFVYNIEVEEDNSYVLFNGVAVHNCEHLQIPELSKGKIVDAVARDIGESVYVDILVATERKHKPLVASIESGQLKTLSMGAQVRGTVCSKCGNYAEDETQLCNHIKYFKGGDFYDASGKKRKIAEICGHLIEEPGSCRFIEASWVANPAFTGAVLRNILSPSDIAKVGNKIMVAFNTPSTPANSDSMLKAARRAVPEKVRRVFAQGDFGTDPQEPKKEDTKPKKDSDPLSKAVDDLTTTIRDHVTEKIRSEMTKDEVSNFNLDENNTNESIIKSALKTPQWRAIAKSVLASTNKSQAKKLLLGLILHKHGGWKEVVKTGAFNGHELLAISRQIDLMSKRSFKAGESRIYRTVLAVNGVSPHKDTDGFLAACRSVLGRDLTADEKVSLTEKGRLFDLGTFKSKPLKKL